MLTHQAIVGKCCLYLIPGKSCMAHKYGWIYVRNERKVVVSFVLMNRYINQSRCEGYIMSAEFYVWHNQKGSLLLRTGISKVKARNTHVLNSSYIKAQHHTLWYYPGKESGHLRPCMLKESNPVSHKKMLFSATVYEKPKRKVRTYSTQHTLKYNTTQWYIPAKESRPYIFEESTCPRPHLFTN